MDCRTWKLAARNTLPIRSLRRLGHTNEGTDCLTSRLPTDPRTVGLRASPSCHPVPLPQTESRRQRPSLPEFKDCRTATPVRWTGLTSDSVHSHQVVRRGRPVGTLCSGWRQMLLISEMLTNRFNCRRNYRSDALQRGPAVSKCTALESRRAGIQPGTSYALEIANQR